MEDSELERFRREWQDEVRAKKGKIPAPKSSQPAIKASGSESGVPLVVQTPKAKADNDAQLQTETLEPPEATVEPRLKDLAQNDKTKTALELYELAVESETSGSLGQSVGLYRKAFRMDPSVDKQYKNKHFPAAPPGDPSKQGPVSTKDATSEAPIPIAALIQSFSDCRIAVQEPMIEGDIPPPCPIAQLPSEILIEILRIVAEVDVASFARSAQICKRFAFVVSTEESIWKSILLGEKYGMSGMKPTFERGILGDELPVDHRLDDIVEVPKVDKPGAPDYNNLCTSLYGSSFRKMFHQHPRIRFTGLYISTVNYARPGASSPMQVSWNTPIHIVTYYRYLRFFRDGTVMSLLSVEEPATIVPIFNRDEPQGKDVPATSPLHNVLRGRWRIAPPSEAHPFLPNSDLATTDPSTTAFDEVEVETEGPVGGIDRYIYKLRLAIRSSSKASSAKNTRLVWRGFWSYNHVSDDWSVFGLRNDRQFSWVRVGSWRDA